MTVLHRCWVSILVKAYVTVTSATPLGLCQKFRMSAVLFILELLRNLGLMEMAHTCYGREEKRNGSQKDASALHNGFLGQISKMLHRFNLLLLIQYNLGCVG